MRPFVIAVLMAPLIQLHSQPAITAEGAILMDAETGIVLFQKNAHKQLFPASTTKIMTALLLVENCHPEEIIRAPDGCKEIEGASIYLSPGETLTAEDMLSAIMIKSANDASYAVACHIGGSVEKFSEMMNERARKIGCLNTSFNNPHGLNDDLHLTTPYDLALITREAMKHERFRKISVMTSKIIERSIHQDNRLIISKNRFLKVDPNAEGVKTGWTIPAGHCFVGAKNVNGWRLISVVLKSDNWLNDTQLLFDWGYSKFQQLELLSKDSIVGNVPVEGGRLSDVPARISDPLRVIVTRGSTVREPSFEWRKLQAPISQGDIVGIARFDDGEGRVVEMPIVAESDVEPALPALQQPIMRWLIFSVVVMVIIAIGFVALRKKYA
jgi:D-alanyl-D-alanine carboxypeptidase (penicillin-binding protein 5/6)